MSDVPPKQYPRERSPEWPKVREEYLKQHPICEACGGTENIEAHHKRPYHLFPELELDPLNLITLCEKPAHDCHFHFGHLLNWLAYNPMVVDDSGHYLSEVRGRLKS